MQFSEKLSALMNIYRISNIVLARGIGIDPSLVSRWKTGNRLPVRGSGTESTIGYFLSGRNLLDQDKRALWEVLGREYFDPSQVAEAITKWLSGNTTLDQSADEESIGELGETLATLTRLLTTPGIPVTSSAAPDLKPFLQPGSPQVFESFNGRHGKRQAATNFLSAAISAGKPSDIYIMNQDDNLWITEDPAFAKRWISTLCALAYSGTRIHMIYTMTGVDSEFRQLLEEYLPLFSSGRFTLFHIPRDRVELTFPSIFVAKGAVAMCSHCTGGVSNTPYTALYKGRTEVELYEKIFNTYLEHTRPLITVAPGLDTRSFMRQIIRLEDLPGSFVSMKNNLNPLWMPESELFQLLSDNMPLEEVDSCLDLFARRRENFETCVQNYRWVEIMPMHIFDAMCQNGSCFLPGYELFSVDNVHLDSRVLAAYLENLLNIMETHPNFCIYLANDLPDDLDIMLKEDYMACFSACTTTRASIMTAETGFLKTIGTWMLTLPARLGGVTARQAIQRVITETLNFVRDY